MPVEPLGYRVATALATKVAELTAAAVPDTVAKFYLRETVEYEPSVDGIPAIVVAKTPSTPIARRKLIHCRELEYPFTVLLFSAVEASRKRGANWLDSWRDGLGDQLDGAKLSGVTEVVRIKVDDSVVLDLTQWESAKLFAIPLNLKIWCRIPTRTN